MAEKAVQKTTPSKKEPQKKAGNTKVTEEPGTQETNPFWKHIAFNGSDYYTGLSMSSLSPYNSAAIQAKLSVGSPQDRYEQEADQVADQVMNMSDGKPDQSPVQVNTVPIGMRQGDGRDETIQTKRAPTTSSSKIHNHGSSTPESGVRGGGEPLSPSLKRYFEPRFKRNFNDVKLHVSDSAAASARAMHARAYTMGNNIAFAAGQFSPETTKGKNLIAHELTHVVQQSGAPAPAVQQKFMTIDECLANMPQARTELSAALTESLGWAVDYTDNSNFATDLISSGMHVLPDDTRSDVTIYAQRIAAIRDQYNGSAISIADGIRLLYNLHNQNLSQSQFQAAVPSLGINLIIQVLARDISDYYMGAVDMVDRSHNIWNCYNTLRNIINSLTDPKLRMQLELEGAVHELVRLRTRFNAERNQGERAAVGVQIGSISRTALLLNDALIQLQNNPDEDTPLDQQVNSVASDIAAIRHAAQSESDTMRQLGDRPELLGAQNITINDALFGPCLGTPYDAESNTARAQVAPEEALPRSTDRASNRFMSSLQRQVENQRSELETLQQEVIPQSFEVPDFNNAFRRWFAFFSLEQERQDPIFRMFLTITNDTYRYFNLAALSGVSAFSGGIAGAIWMNHAVEQMARHAGSATTQFAREVPVAQRDDRVSGRAGRPHYETGEIFQGTNIQGSRSGERRSREAVIRERQQTTSASISRVAAETPGRRPERAVEEGLAREQHRIVGLRTDRAQSGWNYLISVTDDLGENVVALEHRTVPPEVSRYLLAQRQHIATLQHSHRPAVRVPVSSTSSRSVRVGGTAMRQHGVERGEATGTARYIRGELDPSGSSQARALRRTLHQARRGAGLPASPSSPSRIDPMEMAAQQLINRLEEYFDTYYERHQEASYRLASIFIIANVQFNVGQQIRSMITPANIESMIKQALKISLIMATLNSLGPLGRLAATAYRAYLSTQGMDEVAAIISIAGFLRNAGQTNDFHAARAWSYMTPHIAQAFQEIMEAIVSRPVSTATQHGFDAMTRSRPNSPQSMADYCRPLMENPQSRQVLLQGVNQRIAELVAQGADRQQSHPEYSALIIFRDGLNQRTTSDPGRVGVDPNMALPGRVETPHDVAFFAGGRVRSEGERTAVAEIIRELEGVPFVENPTMGSGVRVHYDNGRVRMEVGPNADVRHLRAHLETVRQMRRYQGVVGSIRRVARRVARFLTGDQRPDIGTRGDEARREIAKLTRILDDLNRMQEQVQQREQRLNDNSALASSRAEQQAIRNEIDAMRQQLMEHLQDVNSYEPGRGFIAAEDTVSGGLRLAQTTRASDGTLLSNIDIPDGHYWRARRNSPRPELVNNSGAEVPRSSYDSRLVPYLAQGRSEESRIESTSWSAAFREIGYAVRGSSLSKFTDVLENTFGVGADAMVTVLQRSAGGRVRSNNPRGLTFRTIRSSFKAHYVQTVIMPHLTSESGLRGTAAFQRAVDAGRSEESALHAASHQRMLDITRNMDSADKGAIAERWYNEIYNTQRSATQVEVTREQMNQQGRTITQDRRFDRVERNTAVELKNVPRHFNPRERSEFADHVAMLGSRVQVNGRSRTINRLTWVLMDPNGVRRNAAWMQQQLENRANVSFHIFNSNGERRTINQNSRHLLNQPALDTWLGIGDF